jgi:hypothetical protein
MAGVLHFLPAGRGSRHPLKEAWLDVAPDVLRVASAFSSEAGVDTFRAKFANSDDFDAADNRWLIGIQEGLTQPEALRRLHSLPRSDVRVPFGSDALADPGLRAATFFHPKVYYFENSRSGEVRIASASANLTFRGLTQSVEQVLTWCGRRHDSEAVAFNRWWDEVWVRADVVDPAFVDAYEAKRPSMPTSTPTATAAPAAADLYAANVYWIELTRKPEGGSFNQVELLSNGHLFFYPGVRDPDRRRHRPLSFEDRAGNRYADEGRRVMFNGPPRKPGGNHMWRVYLPTAAKGFVGYQDGDCIVRFERTPTPDHYLIDVAPSRSTRALGWMNSSTGIEEQIGPPPRRMGWS